MNIVDYIFVLAVLYRIYQIFNIYRDPYLKRAKYVKKTLMRIELAFFVVTIVAYIFAKLLDRKFGLLTF